MISIIIPVRNRADGLRRTLASLVPEKTGHEVIVVDGGSVDGGLALARGVAWARLVKGRGNKAALLNAGVDKAKGEILLLLEAGVTLERGWPAMVEEAAARPGFRVGCFRLAVDSGRIRYRLVEALSYVRTVCFGRARIGQVLFVRRKDISGDDVAAEGAAFTGLDLCRRMAGEGGLVQIRRAAVHSPRRWERNGFLAQCIADVHGWWAWRRTGTAPPDTTRRGEAGNAVLMFLRRPDPGKVKPWLGDIIGKERAAAVYKRTVTEVLAVVRASRIEAETFIFYRPRAARTEITRWVGSEAMLVPQQGATPAVQRSHALQQVFGMAYETVLILGSHCPAITPHHLRQAMGVLQSHDLVLGPTDDGGCYLVGVRKPFPELFEQIDWEPDSMFEAFAGAGKTLGLRCASLDPLCDFDSKEDVPYNFAMGFVQD